MHRTIESVVRQPPPLLLLCHAALRVGAVRFPCGLVVAPFVSSIIPPDNTLCKNYGHHYHLYELYCSYYTVRQCTLFKPLNKYRTVHKYILVPFPYINTCNKSYLIKNIIKFPRCINLRISKHVPRHNFLLIFRKPITP